MNRITPRNDRGTPRNSNRTTSLKDMKLKEVSVMSMDFISPELTTFCGIEETTRTRIMGNIGIGNQRGSGHMRAFQAAIFVENDIMGKRILAMHVVDLPANMAFLVANKDSSKASRTTFCLLLRRDDDKALASPGMEMRKIRFGTFHDLEGHSEWKKN